MNEIASKIDNKNVKFSDDKIDELFELLKKKLSGKGIHDLSSITDRSRWWFPGGYVDGKFQKSHYISKTEHLNDLKRKGRIASTNVNAYLTFDAGNSYDKYDSEERTKMCQRKADEILTSINSALTSSTDPLFSQLHAEIKNTKIDYCYERKDQYDDGYDLFCCELWLKISYSK